MTIIGRLTQEAPAPANPAPNDLIVSDPQF